MVGGSAHAQEVGLVETFDEPDLPGWERTSNAVVADGVLRIRGEGFALLPQAEVSGGLILRLRLEGDGFLEVRYHISEAGTYLLRLNVQEAVLLRDAGGRQEILASAPSGLIEGDWWLVEMSLAGTEQDVFVGPGIELHAVDDNPLTGSGLMLHVFGEALAEFDDLTLGPAVESPPPEASPPPSPLPEDVPSEDGELIWTRTGGPPGGLGYDIRYSFADPDLWYVTDAYSGVHFSTDGGLTWHPANTGIPPQAGATGDARPIFSLTVDAHDPDIVWAGTQGTGHIYRSSDRGLTWEQRDGGIQVEHDGLTFRGFTVDPRSSDIVYAMGEINSEALGGPAIWGNGTGGIIYRTMDAGLSWEKIWDGGIPSSLARYLWIDPGDPQRLYVSTGIFDRGAVGEGDPRTDPFGGLGVLVSSDGGSSWQVLAESNGLRMLYIGSLYMHPEDPRILLAAAGHVSTGIAQHAEYLRSRGETSPAGVYRTVDGGDHWTQVLAPPDDRMLEVFSSVEVCPGDPDVAYAASEARVYRSQDAGMTWVELPAGLTGWGPANVVTGFPIDIQCDPRDADRLFINNYGGGNFLSQDGGQSWQSASQGYTGAILRGVAVDPSNPAVVYAAGPSGIWRSPDGGGDWIGIANSDPAAVLNLDWNAVAVDPAEPQHLLLAGSPEVFESLDAGNSWRRSALTDAQGQLLQGDGLAGLSPVSVIAWAPSDPERVYAGLADGSCLIYHEPCPSTGGTILLSRDSGSNWSMLAMVLPDDAAVLDLSIDPRDPQAVWAGTQTGLYHSSDGGLEWRSVSQLPAAGRVSAVAVDPSSPGHLLAALDRVGLWQSTDSGATWQPATSGLEPNAVIHDIVFDPVDPTRLYLSDSASGVYRSTDGGTTWERINQGLTTRAVSQLAISFDGQHLYAATVGEGVFRLDLAGQPPVASAEPSVGTAAAEADPSAATPAQVPQPAPESAAVRRLPISGIVLGVVLGGGILFALVLGFSRLRRC
jgi:photosystem II stability/assembly factor-like uncharacterized protein